MTWVEKMTVTPAAAWSRISCSSFCWLIASSPANGSSRTISRGSWTMVPSSCTVWAMPLLSVRIGRLAQSPWPLSSSSRAPGAGLPHRQAAQRAHEGDRLARGHRRIKAAFLGQIADLARHLERPFVAEQAPRSRRRVDDARAASGGRWSCRRRWAQDAVDAASGTVRLTPSTARLPSKSLVEVPRLGWQSLPFPHAQWVKGRPVMTSLEARIFEKRASWAFPPAASRAPMPPTRRSGSRNGSRPATMARWAGWRARAEQRASPQGLWPEAKSVIALAMSYAPDRPAGAGRGEGPRPHLGLCPGRRLSQDGQEGAQGDGAAGWPTRPGASSRSSSIPRR